MLHENNEMEEDEQEPIITIPKAPGELVVGDYVFACRWGDADPGDPWVVGHVSEIWPKIEMEASGFVVVGDSPMRFRRFPRATKITPEQGERILRLYPPMAHKPLDYKWIAEVFFPTNGSLAC